MKILYVDNSCCVTDPSATFVSGNCRVSVLNRGLLRVEYGRFVDKCTQAVWYRRAKCTDFAFSTDGNTITVRLADKTVVVNVSDFADSYAVIDGKRVLLNNAHNLKGTTRTLDMSVDDYVHYDDPVTHNRKEVYYADSNLLDNGVCATDGVAVYDDSHSLVIDDDGTLLANPSSGDYYVFLHKNDYYGAVSDLYDITGKVPMLPRYVFGNWWSRYWAYTDKEYLALLDRFADKHIPLSVATLDMDWHYVDLQTEFGVPPQGQLDEAKYGEWHGWTGWTWNKHLFPDYKSFLCDVKHRKLHTTLNLHPASGFRWFEDCYKDVCAKTGVDPSTKQVVPFDFANDNFVQAYFDVLHNYQRDGVDFWWIDWQQGNDSKIDGYDPLWGLNHFQYYDMQHDGKRGLILSRYAGVGSHRYPLGFSGDTTQKWYILKYVVDFTATSANVGYTFWSHDIGGHHGGYKDDELYVRWLQFALFNPVVRLHSAVGKLYGKEPWNYDKATELLAIDLLQRRQRLVPYLYSVACANHFDNLPFICPLYYDYPTDKRTYGATGQYMLGDMLVCPITTHTDGKSHLSTRKVYLPEGNWADIYTGTKYAGGKQYKIYRGLGEIPVFCRDGTVLYRNGEQTDDLSFNPTVLQIKLFVGNGSCTIYEDDGETLDYRNGKCLRTFVTQRFDGKQSDIVITFDGDTTVVPDRRTYCFELPNAAVRDVKSNIGTVSDVSRYNGTASFTIGDVGIGEEIRITASITLPQQNEYLARQLQAVMIRVNGDNQTDMDFYDKLTMANIADIPQIIASSKYSPYVKGRLTEIVDGLCKK